MRLRVRKALNLRKYLRWIYKNEWKRTFYGKFSWWIFSLFCQNCQKFRFEWLAKNSSLTGDISAVFSKFTKFPVAFVGWSGDKRFLHITLLHDQWVTWLGGWYHPKSQRLKQEQQKSMTKICMYYKLGQACVTNRGSFILLQIRATAVTK